MEGREGRRDRGKERERNTSVPYNKQQTFESHF